MEKGNKNEQLTSIENIIMICINWMSGYWIDIKPTTKIKTIKILDNTCKV